MSEIEFEVAGRKFRAASMAPLKAFNVGRRVTPVLTGGLKELIALVAALPAPEQETAAGSETARALDLDALAEVLAPMADALAGLSDADAEYVIGGCLAQVKVEIEQGKGWAPIQAGGQLMYDWITPALMLQITWKVLAQNLSGFFPIGARAS